MAQAARLASRMQRELTMLHSDPPPGVSAWPCHNHLLTHLQAQIHGPEGTVYANGIFKLDIQVPERYPFEPPNIKFVTPVYHPNIDNGGRICLDILNLPPKGAWRPSLNLSTLLASIGLLLAEPNPEDGLMGEITAEYKHDRLSFDRKATKWTELYASQDQAITELNGPKASICTETNENLSVQSNTERILQVAPSKEPEDIIAKSDSLLQPLRSGPSVSKRLALDRGTTCLQQNKLDSSNFSHIRINQVHHAVTSKEITSPSKKESMGLQAQSCEKHSSKEELIITEEQSKIGLPSETCKLTSLDKKKCSSQIANEERSSCRNSSKGLIQEIAAGEPKAIMEASVSSVNLAERAAELGEDCQLDGGPSPSVCISANVQNNHAGNRSDGKNLRKIADDAKGITNILGKENQPAMRCPALEPGAAISSPLAAKKGTVDITLIESLGVNNTATAMNSMIHEPGKEKAQFCQPSRTKSLKLSRTKLNAQPTSQQNTQSIPVVKKWTSPPIIIPDDIPTVVVSDSGSDNELSDEGFTISLTQRNLSNKRKSGSKLR